MNQNKHRQRLIHAEKLGIRYMGYVKQADWPTAHRSLLNDIKALGDTLASEYRAQVTIDSSEKPWRVDNVYRAGELAAIMRKLSNEDRNEPGWRLYAEFIIFHRFTVEVTCTRCRSRLWRSEIEAPASILKNSELFDHAKSLEERQQQRGPCQCPGDFPGWSDDQDDRGINMIFSDRAETSIKHSSPVPSGSGRGQSREFPDRVIGLTETENFRALLNSYDNRTIAGNEWKRLRETIKYSPFVSEVKPLLFPFLIVEAKSSKSGFNFHAIGSQTMFCIKNFLELQMNLRLATGKGSFEPLVWFVCYAGQFWNISACYVQKSASDELEFHMITVWEGSICHESQALQILFIMDYIFDWARDIYRVMILNQLGALSCDDLTHTDPDIGSIIFPSVEGRESTWIARSQEKHEAADETLHFPQPSASDFPWNLVLMPHGVIRDASVIQTKLLGIVITENDVDDFLLSFPSEEAARTAVVAMVGFLKISWLVTGASLASLEAKWVSAVAENPLFVNNEDNFLLKIAVQSFVDVEWEPVRQLIYFAISERALAEIFDRTASHVDIHTQLERSSVIDSKIIHLFRQIQSQSVRGNLTAAISMVSMTNTLTMQSKSSRTRRRSKRPDWTFKNTHAVVEFVTRVHEAHKIGRRQPSDPYLRSSSTRSQQSIRVGGSRSWPYLVPLETDQNGCVLVDGTNKSPNMARCCLYIVEGARELSESYNLVKSASERGLYYKTFQFSRGLQCEGWAHSLNRSTAPEGYWSDKESTGWARTWLREIRKHTRQEPITIGCAEPRQCPIPISSDEEPPETDMKMDSD